MATDDIDEFKQCFDNKIIDLLVSKRGDNTFFLSDDQYVRALNRVKYAKVKQKKLPQDYRKLARYDIIVVGDEEKLIKPITEPDAPIQYYATIDQLFDIIHDTHVSIGHAGRNRMIQELRKNYCNITKEVVMIYLSMCKLCQEKNNCKKKKAVPQSVITSHLNSRGQVDLIDMQHHPSNDYNYILVYEDHSTKFLFLKPLKTDSAKEISDHLLDIFTTIGAPSILQSDKGREFIEPIISEIGAVWTEPKIILGRPKESIDLNCILDMLSSWNNQNQTNNWELGLKFVQFNKNRTFHSEGKSVPYEAMFNCKPKLGLGNSALFDVKEILTEDDLIKLAEEEIAAVEANKVAIEANNAAVNGLSENGISNDDLLPPIESQGIESNSSEALPVLPENSVASDTNLAQEERKLPENTPNGIVVPEVQIKTEEKVPSPPALLSPVTSVPSMHISEPGLSSLKSLPVLRPILPETLFKPEPSKFPLENIPQHQSSQNMHQSSQNMHQPQQNIHQPQQNLQQPNIPHFAQEQRHAMEPHRYPPEPRQNFPSEHPPSIFSSEQHLQHHFPQDQLQPHFPQEQIYVQKHHFQQTQQQQHYQPQHFSQEQRQYAQEHYQQQHLYQHNQHFPREPHFRILRPPMEQMRHMQNLRPMQPPSRQLRPMSPHQRTVPQVRSHVQPFPLPRPMHPMNHIPSQIPGMGGLCPVCTLPSSDGQFCFGCGQSCHIACGRIEQDHDGFIRNITCKMCLHKQMMEHEMQAKRMRMMTEALI